VALAIVVWFLAAMSLVVAGIVFEARADIRLAQGHAERARATAQGDGAMQLMLAALVLGQLEGFKGRGTPMADFTVGDSRIRVRLVPVSGLVELNNAPLPLLEKLFFNYRDGLEFDPQVLAGNVLQWRTSSGGDGGAGRARNRFLVVEDLLKVPGVTRTLLDNIRDAVYVGTGAGRGVDWRSAPPAVLALLPEDDPRRLAAGENTGADQPGPGLGGELFSSAGRRSKTSAATGSFRLDALVEKDDRVLLRRRWVVMGNNEASNLPWKFTRSEPARVVQGGAVASG
jgi:hypothetical protein